MVLIVVVVVEGATAEKNASHEINVQFMIEANLTCDC